MKPLDIACRFCAQQPNEPCLWAIDPHPEYHFQRIEDAANWNKAENPVDKQNFDDAVMKTGLL